MKAQTKFSDFTDSVKAFNAKLAAGTAPIAAAREIFSDEDCNEVETMLESMASDQTISEITLCEIFKNC